VKRMIHIFRRLDTASCGSITLEQVMGMTSEEAEMVCGMTGAQSIPQLFDVLDFDNSGTLELEEFCNAVHKQDVAEVPKETQKMAAQLKRLEELQDRIFKVLDDNFSGIDSLWGDETAQYAQ